MTFTSMTFIVFLVIVFTVYWRVPSLRVQNFVLAAASFVFYGWWDWRFCALMILSSLIDYALALGIAGLTTAAARKLLVFFSVAANLTLLGFFKYFRFFQENLIALAEAAGWRVEPLLLDIILPVGISFYTFQSLSYIVDVYRGDIQATRNPIDYLAYVAFFPQLVAGPIERATNLLPQFNAPRVFHRASAVDGCRQILWGFAKKLIVADNLAALVEAAYARPEAFSGGRLALATVFFAFQIYCDFSAYSDIAIGTAKLFGFRLMRNFAYPYFAQDMVEFWRRWHISLSTWFRDYVYVPLGGSRAGRAAMVRNLFLTFLLSGLWHGASWQFVVWGVYHGLIVAASTLWLSGRGQTSLRSTDIPGGAGRLPSRSTLVRMLSTFMLVSIGWVFFRAESLTRAVAILEGIATRPLAAATEAADWRGPLHPNVMCLLIVCLVLWEWVQRRYPHGLVLRRVPRLVRWTIYTLLLWLTLALYAGSVTQFIYFQF
jgi:alginate O-acetyltransferase complex protein AlgI